MWLFTLKTTLHSMKAQRRLFGSPFDVPEGASGDVVHADFTDVKMSEVQLPPARTLEDFLLGSARFSPPDFRDLHCCNNRVINNLLYYQSNYRLLQLLRLSLIGYCQPLKTRLVLLVVVIAFLGFVWVAENKPVARRYRRNYPTSCMFAILGPAIALYVCLAL